MASIYFYYNELLQQSADQAVASGRNASCAGSGNDEDLQQQETTVMVKSSKKHNSNSPAKANENQDEAGVLKGSFTGTMHSDTDAALVMLQPRMNRLAYLQTAGATNLDALARSLGPKL